MKRARKKNDNNYIPADKNIVCSEKRIQVCNFSSVFQTLLYSNFIDAVYTSEILFSPKIFAKIQVRVIRKCGLYTPVYGVSPLRCIDKGLCFSSIFVKGNNICDFLHAFLDKEALYKMVNILKGQHLFLSFKS